MPKKSSIDFKAVYLIGHLNDSGGWWLDARQPRLVVVSTLVAYRLRAGAIKQRPFKLSFKALTLNRI